MLAITVSDPDLIAIIGLALAVVVGTPAWLNFVSRRKNSERIGEVHEWVRPNGAGTLAQMSERLLEQIGLLQHRLRLVESEMSGLRGAVMGAAVASESHVVEDDRRFADFGGRIDHLRELLEQVEREVAEVTERVQRCGSIAEEQ